MWLTFSRGLSTFSELGEREIDDVYLSFLFAQLPIIVNHCFFIELLFVEVLFVAIYKNIYKNYFLFAIIVVITVLFYFLFLFWNRCQFCLVVAVFKCIPMSCQKEYLQYFWWIQFFYLLLFFFLWIYDFFGKISLESVINSGLPLKKEKKISLGKRKIPITRFLTKYLKNLKLLQQKCKAITFYSYHQTISLISRAVSLIFHSVCFQLFLNESPSQYVWPGPGIQGCLWKRLFIKHFKKVTRKQSCIPF